MFSSQMSPGSPFFVMTGDVVCTDVVANGLPTLAFSRGIDMGEGRLWYGEGFRIGVKSPLIVVPGNLTAVRYRDEILRPVAVPLVQKHQITFQHDNARPHIARVCLDFLANYNIVPLDWPPYSPDLFPIEHLWDELDRRKRRRRNTPNTLGQLRTALLEEWENIPMRKINPLVNSMQRRIRAVINARGGHTRY